VHRSALALAHRPARPHRHAQRRQARGNPERDMARWAPGGPGDQERWDLGRVRMAYALEQLVERVHRCAGMRGGGTEELCVQRIKNQERGRSSRESAHGNDGDGTCKKASQPGTKAGITQRKRGGAVAFAVDSRCTWPGASLARRPSAIEGKGGVVLTYGPNGDPAVKASAKRRSTW
jgi:hypothetical protein